MRRPPLLLLVAGVLLLGLLGPSAHGTGYSPLVDEPSSYDAQSSCTRGPQPGTVALSRYLLRTYRATRSLGLMRACGVGGTSEHKDGRAFDWGADVRNPRQKRAAYAFLRAALATDAAGNRHALARRMGIMYLIYADTIWSSYRDFQPRPYLNSGCTSLKRCSRTLRHLNHVHISLGYAGAAAQTSWYRARNVPSLPVFFAGTRELDPARTAVTGVTVPAGDRFTWTPFLLRAGETYRLVVTGTGRLPDGQVTDARCPGAGPGASPGALPLPLLWTDEDCRADHTYEAWFTPLVTGPLPLRFGGPGSTGTFTVYLARADITAASLRR
ncbi:MAG: hypothetical protein J7518_11895 [Nocardioidaceae bacterium]|nr:hypothetical protein [Nocardioidaceae bacterium]